jgi:DNA-directed RNA polymerase sigma subunit (sigma70/sigma32)
VGDPFDFIDEGGWPYPDDVVDPRWPEPADLRSDADEDLVALHALTPHALAGLSDVERAAIVARFGLGGGAPMTMVQLRTSLGLSRDRTRTALSGGLDKLRSALSDGQL